MGNTYLEGPTAALEPSSSFLPPPTSTVKLSQSEPLSRRRRRRRSNRRWRSTRSWSPTGCPSPSSTNSSSSPATSSTSKSTRSPGESVFFFLISLFERLARLLRDSMARSCCGLVPISSSFLVPLALIYALSCCFVPRFGFIFFVAGRWKELALAQRRKGEICCRPQFPFLKGIGSLLFAEDNRSLL